MPGSDRGSILAARTGRGFRCDDAASLQQAVTTPTGEETTNKALTGGGNLTDVVVALSRAQMTLQTATAIRDRVVQAYQDIMKMPI